MFANALLECAPNLQGRRRWILLLSLALQMSAVSLALFYPLLHPEHLPFISTVPKIALLTTPYTQIVSSAGDIVRSTPISRLEWPREIKLFRQLIARLVLERRKQIFNLVHPICLWVWEVIPQCRM
jgi:hypothetical protein